MRLLTNPTPNRLAICVVLLWLVSEGALAAKITASVGGGTIRVNNSFQLTYTANATPNGEPDFRPLKKDFSILEQRSSTSAKLVNGKFTQSKSWILALLAKRHGDLVIPTIKFGKDVSNALIVKVHKKKGKGKKPQDLFIRTEISPRDQHFVQGQILYTLRIYHRGQLRGGNVSAPSMHNATMQSWDKKEYKKNIGGIQYNVIEMKYALFPQQSGKNTIKPVVLDAQVATKQRKSNNGIFRLFGGNTTTKRLTAGAIALNILPKPVHYTAKHWLPANEVRLAQSWSSAADKVTVGEPITRTIRLYANGVTAAQLPKINQASDARLKSYPDQPTAKENKKADGINTVQTIKIAYIATKSGSYTLPAIDVHWFNNKTQKMQTASLPATTLVAKAAPATIYQDTTHTPPTIAPNTAALPSWYQARYWIALSVALLLGWLTTIAIIYRQRRPRKPQTTNHKQAHKTALASLKRACRQNNPSAAKAALLAMAALDGIYNLADYATASTPQLAAAIATLNQHLYSQSATTWAGDQLLLASKTRHKQIKSPKTSNSLSPLYKLRF